VAKYYIKESALVRSVYVVANRNNENEKLAFINGYKYFPYSKINAEIYIPCPYGTTDTSFPTRYINGEKRSC